MNKSERRRLKKNLDYFKARLKEAIDRKDETAAAVHRRTIDQLLKELHR